MGIDCYDLVGATGVKTAGTAHLPWASHHLPSFCISVKGKLILVTSLALVTFMTL